jgi:hypothetical protein
VLVNVTDEDVEPPHRPDSTIVLDTDVAIPKFDVGTFPTRFAPATVPTRIACSSTNR